jgi:hypothetical protein
MAYQGAGSHSPPQYDDNGHRLQDLPHGSVSLGLSFSLLYIQARLMRRIRSTKKRRREDCYPTSKVPSQARLMTLNSMVRLLPDPFLDTV